MKQKICCFFTHLHFTLPSYYFCWWQILQTESLLTQIDPKENLNSAPWPPPLKHLLPGGDERLEELQNIGSITLSFHVFFLPCYCFVTTGYFAFLLMTGVMITGMVCGLCTDSTLHNKLGICSCSPHTYETVVPLQHLQRWLRLERA